MGDNVIRFVSRENVNENVLEALPEINQQGYKSNILFRILTKYDHMSIKSQEEMFDYLMTQARRNGNLQKRNFVLELLAAVGGEVAWEDAEKVADQYLIKEMQGRG